MASEYSVVAHNPATASENKIHDDAVAKEYGFRGGLVPGVVVYAYMTRPPLDRWGLDWLRSGTMTARFLAPVYEGQKVTVALDGETLTASTDDGIVATGTAALPSSPPTAPSIADYPAADPPERADRPPASYDALAAIDVLGSLETGFHATKADAYLGEVSETSPLYNEAGVAHPGWLVAMANYILSGNVRLGPWIHVETRTTHFSLVDDGERVSVRGRVAELFERKGHRFVDLDLLWVADDVRPVVHARHVAIYEPRRGAG
jgi:hypothetical protein